MYPFFHDGLRMINPIFLHNIIIYIIMRYLCKIRGAKNNKKSIGLSFRLYIIEIKAEFMMLTV